MDRSIYTALNSMNILRDNQAVTAQNLANISVTGYQKDVSINFSSVYLDRDKGIDPRVMAFKSQVVMTIRLVQCSKQVHL
jgi:flagellar basal body rod protein FlgG